MPSNRDFLFEPKFAGDLGFDGGVFAYIIDASLLFIQLRNSTEKPT